MTIITIPAYSNLSLREKKVFLINFCSKVKNYDIDLKLQGWKYYSLNKKEKKIFIFKFSYLYSTGIRCVVYKSQEDLDRSLIFRDA